MSRAMSKHTFKKTVALSNIYSVTLGLTKRKLHAAPSEEIVAIWSPHTITYIQKVEQVQRFTAYFVAGDYRRTSNVTATCAS